MGIVRDIYSRQKDKLFVVFKKYLATLCLVFLSCVFFEYLLISEIDIGRTEEYTLIFLGMAIVGTFFTESVLRGRKSREVAITGYIFSGLGAFLWVILDVIAKSANVPNLTKYYFLAVAILYVLILMGLSAIALLKDSKLPFEQYFLRLVISALRLVTILVVLNLGILLLLWLFSTLISKVDINDWIMYVETMLVAIIYVPYGLSCLIDRSEPEQSRFAKGLVLYALMPLLIAAEGIVYIYMARLLITGDIPSNQIFPICAALFIIGFIIWTMAYAYTRRDRTPIYHKLIRYFKYFYAPFLILEGYAIGVRVQEYGWTFLRLCAVAFIVVQFVYLAWEPIINLFRILFHKSRIRFAEHYEWIIFVLFGLYFFAAIVPWTSFIYLESLSQEQRFEENWEALLKLQQLNRTLTPDEYQEVAKLQYSGRSIRNVLKGNVYGEQYLALNHSDADMEKLFSIKSSFWIVGESESIEIEPEQTVDEWSDSQYLNGGIETAVQGLDVSEFNRVFEATAYSAYDFPLEWSDLSRIQLTYGDSKVIEVNLTNCIKQMIISYEISMEKAEEGTTGSPVTSTEDGNAKKDPSKPSDDIYRIQADNGTLFSITNITFRYNPNTKQIRNLSISGYLLFP